VQGSGSGEIPGKVVVADADVVIHFMNVSRLDLLRDHPSAIVVTEHVRKEATDRSSEDKQVFEEGIRVKAFQEITVNRPNELALFARLHAKGNLGAGECSAIAVAISRGHDLAMDDRTATRAALEESSDLVILKTQDIVVSLIQQDVLTLEAADDLRQEWAEHHRFRIPIASFAELL
jgi:predicted nucleic acid-binding protein